MSSSPSPLLLLELMADGEDENSWGDKTNTNLQLIENAIAKQTSVVAGNVNITLTDTQYADDQSRCRCVNITGVLSADIELIVPQRTKDYLIRDQTTGAFTITVITAAADAPLASRLSRAAARRRCIAMVPMSSTWRPRVPPMHDQPGRYSGGRPSTRC